MNDVDYNLLSQLVEADLVRLMMPKMEEKLASVVIITVENSIKEISEENTKIRNKNKALEEQLKEHEKQLKELTAKIDELNNTPLT